VLSAAEARVSLLLSLAIAVTFTTILGVIVVRFMLGASLDEGEQSELQRREVAELKNRRFEREVAARGYERTGATVAAREPEAKGGQEPDQRELTRLESEEVRDGLLAHLATLGGVNLTGPKGESLIRHGGTIPASVLETFDRGRSLFCELKGLGTHYDLVLRLELAKESNVQLRIRRARAVSRETARWTKGLNTGDERFDRTYLLEGKGFVSVEPLQQLEEARRAVDGVFGLSGLETLTIKKGLLRIEGELDAELDREDLAGLLPALRTLASVYEGELLQGIELKAQVVEGTGGLCPYCRDSFDDGLEVIQCSGCATSLHQECHEENGGCPVLGCGVQSTRAPQLA
jgi:RING finger family protein